MKKKFLSLMMAAAVVATTSVSAFAADTTTVTEDQGTAKVTINGSVDADNGTSAPGTISVSVPTAMNFRVDKNGRLEGSNITITNRGVDKVQVLAYEFKNNTPKSEITVKAPGSGATFEKRSEVALWLEGNAPDRAYFQSEQDRNDENGICNASGTVQPTGVVVSKVEPNNGTDELRLRGYAGTTALSNDNKALSGEFTLKLKIQKLTS